MLFINDKRLEEVLRKAVADANSTMDSAARDFLNATHQLVDLKKQIVTLEIERDKKTEDYARQNREIEHKVGLERKRQEMELAAATKDASLKAREEALAADKTRFKEEMDFQRTRLEGEVGSLRELVAEMLKRLPSAEIYAGLGTPKTIEKR